MAEILGSLKGAICRFRRRPAFWEKPGWEPTRKWGWEICKGTKDAISGSGGSGQKPQSNPEGEGLPYFTFGVRRGRKRQAAPVFAVVKVMESNHHQRGSKGPWCVRSCARHFQGALVWYLTAFFSFALRKKYSPWSSGGHQGSLKERVRKLMALPKTDLQIRDPMLF